jgi:signal transduction histidine kinase
MALSFRLRLTLRWTIAFGAVLALVSATIYAGVRAFLVRDLDAELRTLAGTELASAVDEYRGVHLHEFPADAFNAGEFAGKFAQLFDADGRLLMQSPALGDSPPLVEPENIHAAIQGQAPMFSVVAAGRPGRMTALSTAKEGATYVVAVGLFTDPMTATLRRLAWLLAGVSAAGLAATALVGFVLATRALRPIAHVTERAASIARGDFSARLDPPAVEDEIGRMTTLLNDMLERLNGAVAANRRFAADASHELRGPLTAMLGEIDVTLKRDRSAAEYRESLEIVRDRIHELTGIAENLMMLVRAQEGQAPPSTEVPIEPLVAETVADLRGLAADRGVTIAARGLAGVVVYANRPLVARILDNVVRNAVQYNRPGGRVLVSAEVEEPAGGEWATATTVLRVSDTGQGIPPEDRTRVFERFYRIDRSRSRRTGGTGLGLSIASEMVRLLGGSIRVADSSPEGTTFEIRLPGGMAGASVRHDQTRPA